MERAMSITKRQCLFTMISAIVVVVCVCIGVTMNLTTIYDENFDHMGLRTFCMFTVNSNILTAAAMAMVIPYTLDGLRKHNYHMPRWIMVLVYASVTAISLNFLISLCILAPVKGFLLIYSGSRFFLHAICPILAIAAFCFFMSEQKLGFGDSLIALIPVFIYAVLYYIMVVVIGEENGGWNDFYGFATRIPIWIPMIFLMPLTLGIATVLRVLHNHCYQRRRNEEAAFYSEAFAHEDIRQIVGAMARTHSSEVKMRDILVPTRIIGIIMEYNDDKDVTLEELCAIYLKEYIASGSVKTLDKMWI